MAILKGKTYRDTFFDFELKPIKPAIDAPRDSYAVRIQRNCEVEFENIYSVTDFFNGHRDVYRIANALFHARDVAELTTSYQDSENHEFGKEVNDRPLCIREDATWPEIVMWGSVIRNKQNFCVVFYVQPEAVKTNRSIIPLVSVRIPCWVEDAVNFGRELEQELMEAKRLRRELGIPGPFED
jgi:hypothetical protein